MTTVSFSVASTDMNPRCGAIPLKHEYWHLPATCCLLPVRQVINNPRRLVWDHVHEHRRYVPVYTEKHWIQVCSVGLVHYPFAGGNSVRSSSSHRFTRYKTIHCRPKWIHRQVRRAAAKHLHCNIPDPCLSLAHPPSLARPACRRHTHNPGRLTFCRWSYNLPCVIWLVVRPLLIIVPRTESN